MTPTEQIEMLADSEEFETQPRFDTSAIMEVETSSRIEFPPVAPTETLDSPFATVTEDLQISEEEKERWIWAFEQLKSAQIGLSLPEKIRMFCEASSPEEVQQFIQNELYQQKASPWLGAR
jgi:hypothetical protein